MINVELSNIWSCVSLPDLLGCEQDLFEAHLRLRCNQPDQPSFLGWLGQPDSFTARLVHSIRSAADLIQSSADTLVVIGDSPAVRAAAAGVRLFSADQPLRVLFSGSSCSAQDWLQLCTSLEGHSFCLELIAPEGTGMQTFLTSRAIRWLMERQYGQDAKKRIFVCAPTGSPMALMAAEEGYTFLPMQDDPGAQFSSLGSAALLPMAAAGIDPISILEGAVEAYAQYDLRAFENPVWMYAGARYALHQRGKTQELLTCFEPSMAPFGTWWQQLAAESFACSGILPVWFSMPQMRAALEGILSCGSASVFTTLLRTPPMTAQTVNVEMDWKDYDGLGYLDGKTISDVQDAFIQTLIDLHTDRDLPQITLECDSLDAPQFGQLLYFLELADALCAQAAAPERAQKEKERFFDACASQLLGAPQL